MAQGPTLKALQQRTFQTKGSISPSLPEHIKTSNFLFVQSIINNKVVFLINNLNFYMSWWSIFYSDVRIRTLMALLQLRLCSSLFILSQQFLFHFHVHLDCMYIKMVNLFVLYHLSKSRTQTLRSYSIYFHLILNCVPNLT